jgi:hypothetical protein
MSKKKRAPLKPPPILACSRVLYYVRIDKSIAYRGRTLLFVDGKELGRVPCMAICEENRGSGVLLLHCNRNWKDLGVSVHESVAAAKKKAEWIYPGLAEHWKPSHVTKKQAYWFLEKMWGNERCSFCRKRPHEVRQLFGSVRALICDECLDKFHRMMAEQLEASR